jgi:hypothetical protein
VTPRKEPVETQLLRDLNAQRTAAGVCRHCGGPLPCWSSFGDQRVGVRHSNRTYEAMLRRGGARR